jgi:hypothetical protein
MRRCLGRERAGMPLAPLGLFRLRNLAISNVVGVLSAAAMFVWFLSDPLPPARPGLQPARGRARLPAGQPRDDGVLDRDLGAARHALRHLAPTCGRPWRGGARAPALRAGPGRRQLRRRRASEHDPARPRRRHRFQPGAARRDGRCRAERRRARVRRREHLVHDGGALGLAVLASVPVSRTENLEASGDGPLAALTGGYPKGMPAHEHEERSECRPSQRPTVARGRDEFSALRGSTEAEDGELQPQ